MKQSIIAVIPAYDEEKSIGSVVHGCLEHVDHVIVANDGSSDRTSEVAREAGAIVVELPDNGGKGRAQRKGFDEALRMGASTIVYLDGDGQHNPHQIPSVVKPILDGEAEIVVGSRLLCARGRQNIPFYRKIGQRSLDLMVGLGTSTSLYDSQSGFRAISSSALEKMSLHEDGMAIEIEILLEAWKQGLRVAEVPIVADYDVETPSKLNPMLHYYQVYVAALRMIRKRNPRFLPGLVGAVSSVLALVPFLMFLHNANLPDRLTLGILALLFSAAACAAFGYGIRTEIKSRQ